jgi:DeoR/GlpR family transcriptional regulator of sugar metabolism
MPIHQRQREILHRLYLTGYLEARELAASLNVDASTIRRDLDALARDGHLQRTHGGARPRAGTIDLPYAIRQQEHLSAKRAIALAAARFVQDGDRLVLDSGSTTYQLAIELRHRTNLTIVVNDLLIAHTVADYQGVRLLVSGGELLNSTYTLVGDRAIAFIEDLRVDWTFLGADAIDLEAGITNTNTVEIALKRAMLAVARNRIVLADSSKFGQHALVRVAEVTEVDRIITDGGLSPADAEAYGERLERAPEGGLALPSDSEPVSTDVA